MVCIEKWTGSEGCGAEFISPVLQTMTLNTKLKVINVMIVILSSGMKALRLKLVFWFFTLDFQSELLLRELFEDNIRDKQETITLIHQLSMTAL